MAIADTQFWHSCVQLLAGVPQTITPTKAVHGLSIDNDTGAKLYIALNWVSGDDEVSSASFDLKAADGSTLVFGRDSNSMPLVNSYRVISAATGYIGNLGW